MSGIFGINRVLRVCKHMKVFRIINKFRPILSRHQKLRIIEIGIMMMIGAFLEMLSVSLILPFMEAVMNSESLVSNKYVGAICDICGIQSHRSFLVLLALVMSFLYIIKNVFLLYQMLVQNRFVQNNRFATQRKLLRNYLSKPYEFFLNVKSGDVLQVINNDTEKVFQLLSNLLSLFSEMVVSGVLVITILIMSPGITLGVAVLMLLMMGIIQRVIRPILRKMGEESRISNAGMQQWLIQAVQGIKELKIMRSESLFEDKYNEYGAIFVRAAYLSNTLGNVPRFMIEALSMASFFAVIAFMIDQGVKLDTLVPMLSGVAMAAIRLLPSVNRISLNLANIAYDEPSLDKMIEKLMTIEQQDIFELKGSIFIKPNGRIGILNSSISMVNVNYRYPNGDVNVLTNANMNIKKGQSIGVVGSSGAGKTTAIDILLGLLQPSNGSVMIDGLPIKDDMGGWLSQIGYIPQSIFMLDGDIKTNVAFGKSAEEIDDDRIWKVLREAAIDDYVKSLPQGLETEIGERGVRLSGGQRQRIGIARALYSKPEILFFDEATSALDNETEKAIMDSITRLHGQKTIIIIAHRLTTIETCDVIYRVENGKIFLDGELSKNK